MVFADHEISLAPFLQYGSFGLLALLVFWAIAKFFPAALRVHQDALEKLATDHSNAIAKLASENSIDMKNLVTAFEKESVQCREERLQVAKDAMSEREKDRVLRHETNNVLQKLVGKLEDDKRS